MFAILAFLGGDYKLKPRLVSVRYLTLARVCVIKLTEIATHEFTMRLTIHFDNLLITAKKAFAC
jgi:hypothetical protein